MKCVVFDSSTLISLSSSCLFNAVGRMFSEMGLRGVISSGVEAESIITPLRVKRFELNAVRIRHGVEEGWLEIVKLDPDSNSSVAELMSQANSSFQGPRGPLTLVHLGEVEALVLAEKLGAHLVAIDERTTRMLVEEPEKLKRLISRRQHSKILRDKRLSDSISKRFGSLRFIRSSEIAALAFEKGFLKGEIGSGKKALEAVLYSLRYGGCALGSSEIESFLGGLP